MMVKCWGEYVQAGAWLLEVKLVQTSWKATGQNLLKLSILGRYIPEHFQKESTNGYV